MVKLYIGGHAGTIQGEREDLGGNRMFTAAHPPQLVDFSNCQVNGLLDSGAFTDPPQKRLTPAQALDRQLTWEIWASDKWRINWQASGLVSYDLLIDEVWVSGERHKRRWTVSQADIAIRETIAAVAYLSGQREQLVPRKLILSCQGVDAIQYTECVVEVLKYATPDDWIGLGGWCILGRLTRWLPTFWATLYSVLPLIAAASIRQVHIFGVLYKPALGGLLWLADQYGLEVSTDSTAPVLACTWKNKKKSGARREYWRDNVAWWISTLENLRTSEYYRKPPEIEPARQGELF